MTRLISLEHQQISLFEPLFNLGNSAVAPLLEASLPTKKDTSAPDDSVFSEISLTGRVQQCLQLLAPILRELSEDENDRWLTLVSPPEQITAQWLRDTGLNQERILVLRPRGLQSSQELACDALRLGCSHTVISWFKPLPRAARARLTAAARAGATQILNIRQPFTI
ncbi:MAG TPA: CDP-glycerol--UDP-pyrophosphoryl-N-acetylglucosaminyl-N-acetylmannosamine glycerophosphotransferase [Gammaproteobacteria bacterium]|nr:CDP-glycerol--UDP-pyrophosphoryl-N-acetylglucosaminyl-N-acetylmannosamine glycerophosphotransferase [Gammaproteobacteria bacterium]